MLGIWQLLQYISPSCRWGLLFASFNSEFCAWKTKKKKKETKNTAKLCVDVRAFERCMSTIHADIVHTSCFNFVTAWYFAHRVLVCVSDECQNNQEFCSEDHLILDIALWRRGGVSVVGNYILNAACKFPGFQRSDLSHTNGLRSNVECYVEWRLW
jgi:hypothetical protein